MKNKIREFLSYAVIVAFCILAGGSIDGIVFGLLAGAVIGIIAAIITAINDSNKKAEEKQRMEEQASAITRHSLKLDTMKWSENFGDIGWKCYFNNEDEEALIITTTDLGTKEYKISEFQKTIAYDWWKLGVAFDDKNKKLLLINGIKSAIEYHLISYDDLISIEVIENSKTTYSKSTQRTIGGAIVGGALFGKTGAIIGGLSGDTNVNETLVSSRFKLMMRNTQLPSVEIPTYNATDPDFSDLLGIDGVLKYDNHKRWEFQNKVRDTISAIIDMTDREFAAKQTITETPQINSNSIADEIKKLAELRDSGILTNEEFQEQKLRLLSK